MVARTKPLLKVADEVWVATALLHREHPEREDFEAIEIKAKALEQRGFVPGPYREISSVYQHAIQHCVANLPRQTGAYRMLFATGKTSRRLYQLGDPYDPSRESGRMAPERAALPEEYRDLLVWYEFSYRRSRPKSKLHPLMQLSGLGKEIWKGVDPDEYVRELREGWE